MSRVRKRVWQLLNPSENKENWTPTTYCGRFSASSNIDKATWSRQQLISRRLSNFQISSPKKYSWKSVSETARTGRDELPLIRHIRHDPRFDVPTGCVPRMSRSSSLPALMDHRPDLV